MKSWTVTLPVAGHAIVFVEAATKEEALEKARETWGPENLENLDAVGSFNSGNVCHCPQPWSDTVECEEEDDEEE